MRKSFYLIGILILAFVVTFTSCNKNPEENKAQEKELIDTYILSHPPAVTDSTVATFTFSSNITGDLVLFNCQLDSGEPDICSRKKVTYRGLDPGEHTFRVYAEYVSNAGILLDKTPAEYVWRIVPDTVITDAPPYFFNGTEVTFKFESRGKAKGFICRVDREEWQECSSPFVTVVRKEGKHIFEVAAVDEDGYADVRPARDIWISDFTPPESKLVYAPMDYGNSFTGGFVVSFSEKVYRLEWRIDGGDWKSAFVDNYIFGGFDYANLTTGEHKVEIRGIDLAGNVEDPPLSYSWHLTSLSITEPVTRIDIGSATVCAIDKSGKLWCWGDGTAGNIGNGYFYAYGNVTALPRPVLIDSEGGWIDVSTSFISSCGIKEDGSLWCWGEMRNGLLIQNSMTPFPVKILADYRWKKVSAGYEVSCGITRDNHLICWKNVGPPPISLCYNCQIYRTSPLGYEIDRDWVDYGAGWKDVSAGWSHICGIKEDNSLWCWGSNEFGELGVGEGYGDFVSQPVRVEGEWLKVDVGDGFTCGIKMDNSLWCWGDANDGKLGIGVESGNYYYPQQITEEGSWIDVNVGVANGCALRDGGILYCWGANQAGEINESGEPVLYPVRIGDSLFTTIVVGGIPHLAFTNCPAVDTICGLTPDGKFICRGDNSRGQWGNGSVKGRLCIVLF